MITRRQTLGLLAAIPATTLLSRPAFAASPEVFSDGGFAIRGFDPVAYFKDAAPVEGSDEFTSEWKGAIWKFASADNKAAFDADPEGMAPQYGGYCAFAVSKGGIATTDPDAWTVHDGKLYLNYSLNVRTIWSEDIPGNIEKADANWPGVLA
jgi:YHS domain-containing protein